jgi:hypothetical protein
MTKSGERRIGFLAAGALLAVFWMRSTLEWVDDQLHDWAEGED